VADRRPSECPLCGSQSDKNELAPWKTWRWWDCRDCGVAYVTPFRNPGASFYQDYEDLYPVEATGEPDKMSFEYRECLFSFPGSVRGKTLLDVGCGSGGFLNWAHARGFEVTGLDFDARRLELVKTKLGLTDVHQGGLLDFKTDQRFDAITMFQVLEHLDNPAEWLAAAKKLLKPGGKLFLGTPNRDRTFNPFVDGMAQVDNPPNHLTRWRASSLSAFLEKNGLRVLEIKSLGIPLPLYALMLRNKLRFGLATKALAVEELRHEPAKAPANGGGKAGLVRGLVKVKEYAINAAAGLSYPVFRAAFKAKKWEGVVLYCVVST
jgi:SAM-dependent methyltransferase